MNDTTKDEKQAPKRPWRDNIEAITMAIIMAVMLKYFIIEAYKIPTGSMQPTLMGMADTDLNIEDRILVDKLSYHFRDPERFEVVIFKYPLDRSKNFIKRIVGMPNERVRIIGGDLWRAEPDTDDWQIIRKPRHIQEDLWKPLIGWGGRQQKWQPNSAAKQWSINEQEVSARGDGLVRYPGKLDSITDEYKDGYPRKLAARMPPRAVGVSHDVGDLRVRGTATALAGCEEFACVFREGGLEYRCIIPGPAADASAKPRIEAEQQAPGDDITDLIDKKAEGAEAFRLSAGDAVEFSAQNLDDKLELWIDGELICELEIAPALGSTSVSLEQQGEGINWTDLQVDRDIYYSEDRARFTTWDIPEDSYLMLGDNTQDSSDGREWQFRVFELTSERLGETVDGQDKIVLRGNHRGNNENPTRVPHGTKSEMWFRDEWGELYHWESGTQSEVPTHFESAPLVPRHLITGRAVLVFWPMKPSLDVYRLKWIR